MAGNILTTSSTIQCIHGGQAVLFTSNAQVLSDGAYVLIQSDIHPVVGCPFTIGTKYSPCIQIEWADGSSETTVNNTPVLIQSSIGKCLNAEGAVQGIANIINSQIKVSAQ